MSISDSLRCGLRCFIDCTAYLNVLWWQWLLPLMVRKDLKDAAKFLERRPISEDLSIPLLDPHRTMTTVKGTCRHGHLDV